MAEHFSKEHDLDEFETVVSFGMKTVYHRSAKCGPYVGGVAVLFSIAYAMVGELSFQVAFMTIALGAFGAFCVLLSIGSQHLQKQKEYIANKMDRLVLDGQNKKEKLQALYRGLHNIHKGIHSVRDKTTTTCLVEAQYTKNGAEILENDVLIGVLTFCSKAFQEITATNIYTRIWLLDTNGKYLKFLPELSSLNSPADIRQSSGILDMSHPLIERAVLIPEVVIANQGEKHSLPQIFIDLGIKSLMLTPFRMNRESSSKLGCQAKGILSVESTDIDAFGEKGIEDLGLLFGDFVALLFQVTAFLKTASPDQDTLNAINALVEDAAQLNP